MKPLFCFSQWFLLAFTLSTNSLHSQMHYPKISYVNVAVATLWAKPNIDRLVDAYAVSNPVDITKWVSLMSLEDKEQLSKDGMLETQALYGNKVIILEEKNNWAKVAVIGQPNPQNSNGYPGWMPSIQLEYNEVYSHKDQGPFVLITSPTAYLYTCAKLKKKEIQISYNTCLPLLSKTRFAYQVLKPNGKKSWISKKDVKVYKSKKSIPKPTGKKILKKAKKFIGLPYLWAGASGFGFDCSGFVFTLYQSFGITIPRDSGPQYKDKNSIKISKEKIQDLKPGDLLFFAREKGKGKVHHVGMYVGNGRMIHSPNSKKSIEIIPLNTPGYFEEYVGGSRYLY